MEQIFNCAHCHKDYNYFNSDASFDAFGYDARIAYCSAKCESEGNSYMSIDYKELGKRIKWTDR